VRANIFVTCPRCGLDWLDGDTLVAVVHSTSVHKASVDMEGGIVVEKRGRETDSRVEDISCSACAYPLLLDEVGSLTDSFDNVKWSD
jgi:hypothetical protein